MSSFALWFESNDDSHEGFIADVHFNLWNLHYRKAKPPFLDVGIKIYQPQGYSKVFFFIPWKIKKENISDLGCFLKSTEILCTVFNEDYTISQESQSKILNVYDSDGNPAINIYCLDVENDIALVEKYGGTLLTFGRPHQLSGNVVEYYRFRVSSSKFTQIIKKYSPKNVMLQSAISTTEAIDFRFNDYRSLSSSLIEKMRSGISYGIGKVHFLLITEADVDLLYSSTAPTARELEKNTWKKYYDKLGNKHIVAYHWKFKSESSKKLIENCIMFVKTKIHTCNWLTIALYILSAGILAMAFNLLSQILF